MRPRRSVIRYGLVSRSNAVAKLYELDQHIGISSWLLGYSLELNVIVFVFQQLELLLIVQKIVEPSAIDFKKGYVALHFYFELIVVYQMEQIVDKIVLHSNHCISFSGPGLAVREAGDDASVENAFQR